MTDQIPGKDNKSLKFLLIAISTIMVIVGALVAYWLVHEWFGYYGNKSTIFYIGGAFAGYSITEPLWWMYRKKYPKEEQASGSDSN